MNAESARENLRETIALWHAHERTAFDVVLAACDLLAAGAGGMALCTLAAVSPGNAEQEVRELLAAAVRDARLPFHEEGSAAALRAALEAKARLVLSGEIAPHVLVSWASETLQEMPWAVVDRLNDLEYEYDLADHTGRGLDEVAALVMAEARQVVDLPLDGVPPAAAT
ncbi:hypothetical protein [Alloactinosynnema sp. L-07]|uniref:hypothetical protein n=1 Tax=Alloactinosynnema sp. L-07 TaxID=1653480 RepID=UPI0012FC25EE|nr:hypothetical protein [Alloactinosynnema sp. L-07]